jgi:transcription elongation factor Elf1
MKIKNIERQNRRDFYAVYECEHCGATERGSGYDDTHFHQNVIPAMPCAACGKKAPAEYRALAPKYDASVVI